MPFEPLRTDEPLTEPGQRPPDMDTQMLGGCSTFVAASFLTYFIGVWPFLIFRDLHLLRVLGMSAAFGLLPALVFGALASRRAGAAAACGFVGGAAAIAIFLHLRLDQVMLGFTIRDIPRPEYPYSWLWYAPLIWLGLATLDALLFVRKDANPKPPYQGLEQEGR